MPSSPSRSGLAATLATMLVAALIAMLAAPAQAGSISGSALYRERIAMPPDAVFEAVLLDLTQSASGRVIGRFVRDPSGQPPFSFKISYDDNNIDPNHRYALRAHVTQRGRLLFASEPMTIRPDKPSTPRLLLIAARPAQAAAPASAPLRGTTWKLTALNGVTVPSGERQREPHMIFSATEAHLSGHSGCNNFFGSFDTEGAQLRLKGLGKTMMACQQGMALESQFMAALGKITSYRIQGEELLLLGQNDAVLARFSASLPR